MRWSEREIKLLKKFYSVLSWFELLKLLKSRSREAIEKKASRLGLAKNVGVIDEEYLAKLEEGSDL